MPTYYEFFAGGGMVRAALSGWKCSFANDFDKKKVRAYAANWGGQDILCDDIRNVGLEHLPGRADLMWGSFPCQDLSLAGGGAGLKGDRSGTFWPFWNLIKKLDEAGRKPSVVVIENVCGTITSHKGEDFQAICEAFSASGYNYGAIVIDAKSFLPQSRKRLFVIGVDKKISLPQGATSTHPSQWITKSLESAHENLTHKAKQSWVWWDMPPPPKSVVRLEDIIENQPADVSWHSEEETNQLLRMMSSVNQRKVFDAQRAKRKLIGTLYRRTRISSDGSKIQRAEVRFDGVAGCLRTPAGGSSRQILVYVDGSHIRTRLLSAREAARLMGLEDNYKLPNNYNEAYHLAGDGVAVPAVRYLAHHILSPVLRVAEVKEEAA